MDEPLCTNLNTASCKDLVNANRCTLLHNLNDETSNYCVKKDENEHQCSVCSSSTGPFYTHSVNGAYDGSHDVRFHLMCASCMKQLSIANIADRLQYSDRAHKEDFYERSYTCGICRLEIQLDDTVFEDLYPKADRGAFFDVTLGKILCKRILDNAMELEQDLQAIGSEDEEAMLAFFYANHALNMQLGAWYGYLRALQSLGPAIVVKGKSLENIIPKSVQSAIDLANALTQQDATVDLFDLAHEALWSNGPSRLSVFLNVERLAKVEGYDNVKCGKPSRKISLEELCATPKYAVCVDEFSPLTFGYRDACKFKLKKRMPNTNDEYVVIDERVRSCTLSIEHLSCELVRIDEDRYETRDTCAITIKLTDKLKNKRGDKENFTQRRFIAQKHDFTSGNTYCVGLVMSDEGTPIDISIQTVSATRGVSNPDFIAALHFNKHMDRIAPYTWIGFAPPGFEPDSYNYMLPLLQS
ncbi:hypothetical protein CYMTET_44655 [Cymbomonas tetramitiformis]|nr:hypothetical protein CYMTET_44655 [Cymbomonas tetramitiformis]